MPRLVQPPSLASSRPLLLPCRGRYCESFDDGVYHCAGCLQPLYDSSMKFKTGHGWPAFCDNLPDALTRHESKRKVEIVCSGCDGHVGHVFHSKRYPKPHHERHCVNSVSLTFVPRGAAPSPRQYIASAAIMIAASNAGR